MTWNEKVKEQDKKKNSRGVGEKKRTRKRGLKLCNLRPGPMEKKSWPPKQTVKKKNAFLVLKGKKQKGGDHKERV